MFPQSISTFDEIGDPNDILKAENLLDYDYQELQTKYNVLCRTYAEEIETSSKIKRSLGKCLKFYSKLCKKYEAQQVTINSLQKTVNQKMNCLEESLKNQEKMKGLIDMYKRERILYCPESIFNLKKDRELLLDLCCKLISDSVKNNNIRSITNLILKKFKNDLDKDKINMLKEKLVFTKSKLDTLKNSVSNFSESELKFEAKEIKDLENTNLDEDNLFKNNKLEKLDLDSYEIPDLDNKETIQLCTKNASQNIKILEETIDSCLKKNDIFKSVEDKEEKTKFNINENVPSISSLNSNILYSAEESDVKFLESNSYCDNIQSGNKVVLNDNSEFSCNTTEKNNELKVDMNIKNTDAERRHSVFSFDKSETLINNSFEFNQNNENICTIEKSSLVSDSKENIMCDSFQNSSDIAPKIFKGNLQENSAIDLNQIEIKENNTKGTLNSELNNINLIFDSSKPLPDLQKNLEENENKNDLKCKELIYSNKCDKTHLEKNIFEKTELRKSANLDNFTEITVNKQDDNKIYTQSPNDSEIDTSSFNAQNLNDFLNNKPDSEVEFEEFDSEKLEVINSELSQIFTEMSTLRLLSPIRELNKNFQLSSPNKETNNGDEKCTNLSDSKSHSYNQNLNIKQEKRKSTVSDFGECKKIKLNRKKNIIRQKKETSNGLLDTIMNAMSTQVAQFRSNFNNKTEVVAPEKPLIPDFKTQITAKEIPQISKKQNLEVSTISVSPLKNKEVTQQDIKFNSKINFCNKSKKTENKLNFENSVTEKIQQFISSSISSNEEAQKKVADCLAALENFSAVTIAKSIVGLVLANIDEKVEIFERPVPPLTKTQCRLITLLSVLKMKNFKFEEISSIIMEEISTKLFPDNFFWPDDSVEMACRFYTAICKNRNESESLWKFCLQAMMDMKQRSCIVVFTVLKTWPDILHEKPTLKNNILATTIVNIILHASLNNTLANGNQKKKLLALKHLLMNFYGFEVDHSIEEYSTTLLESFFKNDLVAEKSVVLLIKCRDIVWAGKHIFPKLGKVLKEWMLNPVDDVGNRILRVLKQTVSVFTEIKGNFQTEAQIVISFLSDVLSIGKLNHELEQKVVEILLCLKHYPEAKKKIREWIPKGVVKKCLKNEILNLSSENILRELKFNRRKDLLENSNKSKKKKRKFGDKSEKNRKGKCKKINSTNKPFKGKVKNCKPQLDCQGSN